MRCLTFALCLAAPWFATPALADPRIVSTAPGDASTASHITQVSLTFSEALVPAMSGMDVLMTAMPGMDHHQPMKMTGVVTSVAPDGVSLVARLARPLPAGVYEADWHVASADTHRVTGKLTFTVK